MENQEKLSKIKGLSEKELRKGVLIPLFNSIGLKGVMEYHGPGERGKDLIFYAEDSLGDREYTAVVVKTEKIHGSVGKAGSVTDIVFTQVQQALNEPYIDVYQLAQIMVDKCMVVTSHDIVKTSIEQIFGTLKTLQLHRVVKFRDGDWIVRKIDRFMPTYFEERDRNEIIEEKEKQISEFKEKRTRAVEVIYDMGREFGVPRYVADSTATPIFTTSSEFDLGATLVSGTTTFDPYIPKSKIVERLMQEKVIPENVSCPHCGTKNWIDPKSVFVICTYCGRAIY